MIAIRRLAPFLRIYVAAGLIASAVLSPLAYSAVPIAVLLWYVFQWRRRTSATIGVLSEWFAFTSIALFLSRTVGLLWSLVLAAPVLLLVTAKLEDSAASRTS